MLPNKLGNITNIGTLEQVLTKFRLFLEVDRQLTQTTIYHHVRRLKILLQNVKLNADTEEIRTFLSQYIKGREPATSAGMLKTLRVFYRDFLGKPDMIATFRFPYIPFKPKKIPTREQLIAFYNKLPTLKTKLAFMLFATSGLRRREALTLEEKNVDMSINAIYPSGHVGRTKRAWVTFFNEESKTLLKMHLDGRNPKDPRLLQINAKNLGKAFRKAAVQSGIMITPQLLRDWFCEEMGNLGLQDRYIDAFCGRIPQSVLARNYTDYAPSKLKVTYERAGLKVFQAAIQTSSVITQPNSR